MPQPTIQLGGANATRDTLAARLKARVALLALFVGSMWAVFFVSAAMPARHPLRPMASCEPRAHRGQHRRVARFGLAMHVAASIQFLGSDRGRDVGRGPLRMVIRCTLLDTHRSERAGVRLCRLSGCARLLHAPSPFDTSGVARHRQFWSQHAGRRASALSRPVVAEPYRRLVGWSSCGTHGFILDAQTLMLRAMATLASVLACVQ
jgi:hypothetical protein